MSASTLRLIAVTLCLVVWVAAFKAFSGEAPPSVLAPHRSTDETMIVRRVPPEKVAEVCASYGTPFNPRTLACAIAHTLIVEPDPCVDPRWKGFARDDLACHEYEHWLGEMDADHKPPRP